MIHHFCVILFLCNSSSFIRKSIYIIVSNGPIISKKINKEEGYEHLNKVTHHYILPTNASFPKGDFGINHEESTRHEIRQLCYILFIINFFAKSVHRWIVNRNR